MPAARWWAASFTETIPAARASCRAPSSAAWPALTRPETDSIEPPPHPALSPDGGEGFEEQSRVGSADRGGLWSPLPRRVGEGRVRGARDDEYALRIMKIGFHLTPFWSPTDRGATRIIDEAIEVVAAASRMGFAWVSIGQHWISHPTVWPQPFPILARLAPETGQMRLKTSVLLLPIVNAVETAESIATLDHIPHGRLDVGVAIGYRERELEAAGLARKDRVPKLEESLTLMEQICSGEEATFHR